jgi:hypothetical protein
MPEIKSRITYEKEIHDKNETITVVDTIFGNFPLKRKRPVISARVYQSRPKTSKRPARRLHY